MIMATSSPYNQENPLYIVALSGGVDSAVALYLAKQKSPHVVGITHRHWPESKCCTSECIDHCREQARAWNIPFYAIDTMSYFAQNVVDQWSQEYLAGRTPNPCVHCNELNRFGEMVTQFFQKFPEYQTEHYYLVTGHYARIDMHDASPTLRRGLDPSKDQSYMLYRLNEKQRKHVWFPLGSTHKENIRSLATDLNLWAAKVSDSQDICFVQNDHRTFLQEYTGHKTQSGNFISSDGKIMGQHTGVVNYHRGQRKGLGLSGGPWYVLNTNIATNEVFLGREDQLLASSFTCSDIVWHTSALPQNLNAHVQVRYHGTMIPTTVSIIDQNTFKIDLLESSRDITPGQSAVIYRDDIVMGGGIIQKILK